MSAQSRYRLADSTLVEPLVHSWPAWSYLLSPLPSALHVQHYQIKTMQSYLENPEMHIAASRDPEMFGGPFVDVPIERADDVLALLELLDLTGDDEARVLPLLTEAPPTPRAEPWRGDDVRVRYIGHACALIEWQGISVLTDPFVPVRPTAGGMNRISFGDLPEHIDFAIVTHNHQDHFALECLLRLRHRIGCLVLPKPFGLLYGDLSLKLLARTVGFPRVVELDSLETLEFPGGGITSVTFEGEHADLAHGKNGYVVSAGGCRFWFAADSDCLDRHVYERVREAVGPVDVLFVGTESVGGPLSWTNGPLLPKRAEAAHEQGRRYHGCSARSAFELLEGTGARQVYIYALGLEPWMDHLLGRA